MGTAAAGPSIRLATPPERCEPPAPDFGHRHLRTSLPVKGRPLTLLRLLSPLQGCPALFCSTAFAPGAQRPPAGACQHHGQSHQHQGKGGPGWRRSLRWVWRRPGPRPQGRQERATLLIHNEDIEDAACGPLDEGLGLIWAALLSPKHPGMGGHEFRFVDCAAAIAVPALLPMAVCGHPQAQQVGAWLCQWAARVLATGIKSPPRLGLPSLRRSSKGNRRGSAPPARGADPGRQRELATGRLTATAPGGTAAGSAPVCSRRRSCPQAAS